MDSLTFEDELDILIAEIEKRKSSARIAYDDLKHSYLQGDYRRFGTKREVESKLSRLSGEVVGFENALSVLYTRRSKNG